MESQISINTMVLVQAIQLVGASLVVSVFLSTFAIISAIYKEKGKTILAMLGLMVWMFFTIGFLVNMFNGYMRTL